MLIPAISKRDELRDAFWRIYYTDDMMYETGGLYNWSPNIVDEPEIGDYQYAIVDDGNPQKLIGFLTYHVDWYSSCASRFGLISFDKGNPIVGLALKETLNKLINEYKLHRIEWRMVGGNPVERHYDSFLKRYNGKKYILRDVFKDVHGIYHDDCIYEIIMEQ